jgi:hypothetical protein
MKALHLLFAGLLPPPIVIEELKETPKHEHKNKILPNIVAPVLIAQRVFGVAFCLS